MSVSGEAPDVERGARVRNLAKGVLPRGLKIGAIAVTDPPPPRVAVPMPPAAPVIVALPPKPEPPRVVVPSPPKPEPPLIAAPAAPKPDARKEESGAAPPVRSKPSPPKVAARAPAEMESPGIVVPALPTPKPPVIAAPSASKPEVRKDESGGAGPVAANQEPSKAAAPSTTEPPSMKASGPCAPGSDGVVARVVVYFPFGSRAMVRSSEPDFARIVEKAKACSKANIELRGHTDHLGAWRVNLVLSSRRTFTIKRRLIGEGIDRTRVITLGHSEDKPVSDNHSVDGRAKNRRVEITLK